MPDTARRLAILVLVLASLPVWAAGTVTLAPYRAGNIRKIVATIVADAAAATVPDTALSAFEGRLVRLVTNPGATAPTDNYDITLEDQNGIDVLQGLGANRDTTNSESAVLVYTGTSLHPIVDEQDTLTLKVANNAVNSAQIVVELYYVLGG